MKNYSFLICSIIQKKNWLISTQKSHLMACLSWLVYCSQIKFMNNKTWFKIATFLFFWTLIWIYWLEYDFSISSTWLKIAWHWLNNNCFYLSFLYQVFYLIQKYKSCLMLFHNFLRKKIFYLRINLWNLWGEKESHLLNQC